MVVITIALIVSIPIVFVLTNLQNKSFRLKYNLNV